MTASSYPLQWPEGWPRTANPERSRFDCSFETTRKNIVWNLHRMGVSDWEVVLSANLELRRDGYPYANRGQPRDTGVAVYWIQDGAQRVIACDRWDRVKDNMRAVEKTLEALRGIDRWGTSDIVNKAFAGFTALPAPAIGWREILGRCETLKQASEARNRLAFDAHPDRGGSNERMSAINSAWEEAEEELSR